eukprot:gene3654-biopygen1472
MPGGASDTEQLRPCVGRPLREDHPRDHRAGGDAEEPLRGGAAAAQRRRRDSAGGLRLVCGFETSPCFHSAIPQILNLFAVPKQVPSGQLDFRDTDFGIPAVVIIR